MGQELNKVPVHVAIIGASGHARVIADIIRCSGDIVEGYLDDREANQFPGMRILGHVDDATALAQAYPRLRFIIGIGNNTIREKIADNLQDLYYHTAIHPSAVIAQDVAIGPGCVVMANAVVNTGATIGAHVIINTSATIDHDCKINDFVHISPGVHISGTVRIGRASWLGTGTVVSNNVNICCGCTIGAGAVVIENIDIAGTYVGIPSKKVN